MSPNVLDFSKEFGMEGLLGDPNFIVKKNDQQYEFRIFLQNFSDMDKTPPKTATPPTSGAHAIRNNFKAAKAINPTIVTELVITENLHDWQTSGYMVVQSTLEGFERKPSDIDSPDVYTMRMDCRDMLLIYIMPLGEKTEKGKTSKDGKKKKKEDPTGSMIKNSFPVEQYLLRGEFVIYDTEDIFTEDLVLKAKKLYFHELRYQLASELRLQFSTNDNKLFTSADPLGRVDNEVATGTILRTLLYMCNDPKIGFGWGNMMQISTNKDLWDEGGSKIFFTAPANYTVIDSINYILDRHVSKAGSATSDLCVFTSNRYTDEFELLPFSKLFELSTEGSKPGKYQIEHMFIPTVTQLGVSATAPVEGQIGNWRAPIAQGNDPILDVKLSNFGYLSNYRFIDFSGIDNAKTILTRPVFSYDFRAHTFVCEYKDHNVQKTKDFLKTNYTDKMYGGVVGKPSPLLTLNELKKKQKVLEPAFSTKKAKESRFNDGRNKALFTAVYLNEHIVFTTLGSTNRTSGRFIGLDKENKASLENEFDHRLLGQWLVTEVKHVFTQNSYINEIQAVKIQSYREVKINEDIP